MIYKDEYRIGFKKVTTITVTNSKNLRIVLCSMGASIFKCYFGNKKITYGPRYLVDFVYDSCFYGKTVGRTAGRIKNGLVLINGKRIHLAKSKIHSLHGGFGFSFKVFNYEYYENDEEYTVKFQYVSNDGEKGYPGKLVCDVIYHIFKEEDKFTIEYKAISSKDTICNLTNHAYWTLNNDKKNILDDTLFINADKYVRINKELLKEEILPVNEVFDFRKGKLIGKDILDPSIQEVAKGYDHDFILNDDSYALKLVSPDGLSLKVTTSNPVCHIYTNNYLNGEDRYSAIAIEMQKRIFDVDEGAVDLHQNEKYHEYITYEFKKN